VLLVGLTGGPLLVLSDGAKLAGYLGADTRKAVEAALLHPGSAAGLACACCPSGGTHAATATMPDTCAAYSLLTATQCEFVSVHDWFQAFLRLHVGASADGEVAAEPPAARAGDKRRRGGGRSVGGVRIDEERLWQLQARFTSASQELQYMGFLRAAKRKRGLFVQRLVFGSDFAEMGP
jgi:hypothetical protein